jgi:hypothetical protein
MDTHTHLSRGCCIHTRVYTPETTRHVCTPEGGTPWGGLHASQTTPAMEVSSVTTWRPVAAIVPRGGTDWSREGGECVEDSGDSGGEGWSTGDECAPDDDSAQDDGGATYAGPNTAVRGGTPASQARPLVPPRTTRTCCICLDSLERTPLQGLAYCASSCGNVYHRSCVAAQSRCPLCRATGVWSL